MPVFRYYVRSQYGRVRKYPATENGAKALRLLAGRATLTDEIEEGLSLLGFTMQEVADNGA